MNSGEQIKEKTRWAIIWHCLTLALIIASCLAGIVSSVLSVLILAGAIVCVCLGLRELWRAWRISLAQEGGGG